jgi:hypothetical protein
LIILIHVYEVGLVLFNLTFLQGRKRKSEKQKRTDILQRVKRFRVDERRKSEQLPDIDGPRPEESIYNRILTEFRNLTKQGPTFTCCCCGGLWFRNSVRPLTPENKDTFAEEFRQLLIIVKGDELHICRTCWKSVSQKTPKIPRLCLSNGFEFPAVPAELKDLTPLEERLVALRLPFYQIKTLGSDRQCGIRGNIVNVMNDLDTTAKVCCTEYF